MSCGIYKITNLVNNKCYIGQSQNIQSRWSHHRSFKEDSKNYPLYSAFKKYGMDNFKFEILEECLVDKLDEREIYWIDYYDSYNTGYNNTTGGQGWPNAIIKISKEDLKIIYDLLQNSSIPQREIAKRFNVGEDTISEINNGKSRVQIGYTYPLRNNRKEKNYCIDCGREITASALRCNICDRKRHRVAERPSREELKLLIRTKPFTQIGVIFNVSDNAVRKWCINYNLPRTKKEINSYSDEEWANI